MDSDCSSLLHSTHGGYSGGRAPSINSSAQRSARSSFRRPGGRKEDNKFETYMSIAEVQQSLKKGELVEGILRINPRNYEDSYITAPDGEMDIYIEGVRDRNRALNGDRVAVQIKPPSDWKILKDRLNIYRERHAGAIALPAPHPPHQTNAPDTSQKEGKKLNKKRNKKKSLVVDSDSSSSFASKNTALAGQQKEGTAQVEEPPQWGKENASLLQADGSRLTGSSDQPINGDISAWNTLPPAATDTLEILNLDAFQKQVKDLLLQNGLSGDHQADPESSQGTDNVVIDSWNEGLATADENPVIHPLDLLEDSSTSLLCLQLPMVPEEEQPDVYVVAPDELSENDLDSDCSVESSLSLIADQHMEKIALLEDHQDSQNNNCQDLSSPDSILLDPSNLADSARASSPLVPESNLVSPSPLTHSQQARTNHYLPSDSFDSPTHNKSPDFSYYALRKERDSLSCIQDEVSLPSVVASCKTGIPSQQPIVSTSSTLSLMDQQHSTEEDASSDRVLIPARQRPQDGPSIILGDAIIRPERVDSRVDPTALEKVVGLNSPNIINHTVASTKSLPDVKVTCILEDPDILNEDAIKRVPPAESILAENPENYSEKWNDLLKSKESLTYSEEISHSEETVILDKRATRQKSAHKEEAGQEISPRNHFETGANSSKSLPDANLEINLVRNAAIKDGTTNNENVILTVPSDACNISSNDEVEPLLNAKEVSLIEDEETIPGAANEQNTKQELPEKEYLQKGNKISDVTATLLTDAEKELPKNELATNENPEACSGPIDTLLEAETSLSVPASKSNPVVTCTDSVNGALAEVVINDSTLKGKNFFSEENSRVEVATDHNNRTLVLVLGEQDHAQEVTENCTDRTMSQPKVEAPVQVKGEAISSAVLLKDSAEYSVLPEKEVPLSGAEGIEQGDDTSDLEQPPETVAATPLNENKESRPSNEDFTSTTDESGESNNDICSPKALVFLQDAIEAPSETEYDGHSVAPPSSFPDPKESMIDLLEYLEDTASEDEASSNLENGNETSAESGCLEAAAPEIKRKEPSSTESSISTLETRDTEEETGKELVVLQKLDGSISTNSTAPSKATVATESIIFLQDCEESTEDSSILETSSQLKLIEQIDSIISDLERKTDTHEYTHSLQDSIKIETKEDSLLPELFKQDASILNAESSTESISQLGEHFQDSDETGDKFLEKANEVENMLGHIKTLLTESTALLENISETEGTENVANDSKTQQKDTDRNTPELCTLLQNSEKTVAKQVTCTSIPQFSRISQDGKGAGTKEDADELEKIKNNTKLLKNTQKGDLILQDTKETDTKSEPEIVDEKLVLEEIVSAAKLYNTSVGPLDILATLNHNEEATAIGSPSKSGTKTAFKKHPAINQLPRKKKPISSFIAQTVKIAQSSASIKSEHSKTESPLLLSTKSRSSFQAANEFPEKAKRPKHRSTSEHSDASHPKPHSSENSPPALSSSSELSKPKRRRAKKNKKKEAEDVNPSFEIIIPFVEAKPQVETREIKSKKRKRTKKKEETYKENKPVPWQEQGKAKGESRKNRKLFSMEEHRKIQEVDKSFPSDKWTVEELLRHPLGEKFIQKTGKVVCILEKKSVSLTAGHIKLQMDHNQKWALFVPNDHRFPRMLIPMEECPTDFPSRPGDYAAVLFLASLVEWNEKESFAKGKLMRSLGNSGDIEAETIAILLENGVDDSEFPKAALEGLPLEETWVIPEEEFKKRRDFRKTCVFTIDPSTARDLDDALSCVPLENGNFEVGVHIADVSFFVKENTKLDEIAQERGNSVYLVQKVVPMLPRVLCERLCSLNPDSDKLTFSVVWEMTPEGTHVGDAWFGRSVIRSCTQLSYEHAQDLIKGECRPESLPPINGGFTHQDIAHCVLHLHSMAVHMRQRRFDSGALRLDQIKLQFALDDSDSMPFGFCTVQQKDSHRLVEEFMLYANMAVARKIYDEFPEQALLRRHPPPQNKVLNDVVDSCESLGVHIDSSSAGSLQKSLNEIMSCGGPEDVPDMLKVAALSNMCTKSMMCALYFCSGCLEDPALFHHYALNVPLYTHFTSPIRRFPDILVHRLLAAALGYQVAPATEPAVLQKWAEHCNDTKYNARRANELSNELFLNLFIKKLGGLSAKGMVMAILDHSFDVLVDKLGIVKRVYCDKLEYSYLRPKGVPQLTIQWKKEEQKVVHQTIRIFSVVDIFLKGVSSDPLKIQTTLRPPS